MVYLVTGPRGSGKTQQMIDLANEKVKTSNGNVVFIKKSHKDTYTVDFNIRVIRLYSKTVHSAIDCEPFFNSFIVLFSLR